MTDKATGNVLDKVQNKWVPTDYTGSELYPRDGHDIYPGKERLVMMGGFWIGRYQMPPMNMPLMAEARAYYFTDDLLVVIKDGEGNVLQCFTPLQVSF